MGETGRAGKVEGRWGEAFGSLAGILLSYLSTRRRDR